MNFTDLFSNKFNEDLANEILNVLNEDTTTPYKILTLKMAELYDNAEPGAKKEALRQTGLQYAKKAELEGKTIFLEEISLLAEPEDYPDILEVYMPSKAENTFANQLLNAYEQQVGIQYGPQLFFPLEPLNDQDDAESPGNHYPDLN